MGLPTAQPDSGVTRAASNAQMSSAAVSAAPVRDHLMPEARQGIRASVVVCVYTETRLSQIRTALDSVVRQTIPPWQVIVVADHNPALRDRLAADHPDLEVISNKFEKGLSGARNTGILHAA